MRCRTLILFFLPCFLQAAPLKVDHATVAGSDLQRVIAAFNSIGIPTEYGGPHASGVTEMALTSFPDGSYLEFIAPLKSVGAEKVNADPWAKAMLRNAGPCAWAIRVDDVSKERHALQAAGVDVNPPVRSGRTKPDGERLEWETAQIGPEPKGTFFPFAIRDFTKREDRVFLKGKPTTKDFIGITRVVIAVRDLKTSVKRYRDAFGLPAPINQVDPSFGANLAIFSGTPVILVAPLNGQTWIASRLTDIGEGPCAFVLGARKASRYKAASKTRWSMAEISWFDTGKLGWHLGFE